MVSRNAGTPWPVHPDVAQCVGYPRGHRLSQLPYPELGQTVERMRTDTAGS